MLGLSSFPCPVSPTWALDWTAQVGVLTPPLIPAVRAQKNSSHQALFLSSSKWAYVEMEWMIRIELLTQCLPSMLQAFGEIHNKTIMINRPTIKPIGPILVGLNILPTLPRYRCTENNSQFSSDPRGTTSAVPLHYCGTGVIATGKKSSDGKTWMTGRSVV